MANLIIHKNKNTVDSLYQWDLFRTLEIHGLSLPSVPEIHFANATMKEAIVRQSTMDASGVVTVDIPNSILTTPQKINVYVCVYDGDTFKTLYTVIIPIIPRVKPADYILETEEEIYSFNALENLVNNTIIDLTAKNDALRSEVKTIIENAKTQINADNALFKTELTADYKEVKEIATNSNATADEAKATADEANSIAKGKNKAHVFSTTDDLYTWLSDPDNAGLYQVGDNLYIVDTGVPDWWISEVLTEADEETGYYYKIAQLETQKVDLTEIMTNISNLETNKISYSDIVDNLTSTDVDKPLSANQGKVLKAAVDEKSDSDHKHSNASTSAAGFMTAAMVTKLNGITTGAKKVTISRKEGTLNSCAETGSYVDLGDGTYGSASKGFIIGVNAYQTTNAQNLVVCAVQTQRYLRFRHWIGSNVGVTYEYFVLKVS